MSYSLWLRFFCERYRPSVTRSRGTKFQRGLVNKRMRESPASILTKTSRVARMSATSGSESKPPIPLTKTGSPRRRSAFSKNSICERWRTKTATVGRSLLLQWRANSSAILSASLSGSVKKRAEISPNPASERAVNGVTSHAFKCFSVTRFAKSMMSRSLRQLVRI